MIGKQVKWGDKFRSSKAMFWFSLIGMLLLVVIINLLGYKLSQDLSIILEGLVILLTFFMFIPEPETLAQFTYDVWNVFFLSMFVIASFVLVNVNRHVKTKRTFKFLVVLGVGCFYAVVWFLVVEKMGIEHIWEIF